MEENSQSLPLKVEGMEFRPSMIDLRLQELGTANLKPVSPEHWNGFKRLRRDSAINYIVMTMPHSSLPWILLSVYDFVQVQCQSD